MAGSVPAGIEAYGHAAIVEACRRAGCPLLVDASGQGLLVALGAGPDVVKVGREEVLQAGLVEPQATSAEAATALVDRGAVLAIVTDGRQPVVAADAGHIWRVDVPRVEAVNAVGSGDSFNAAFSLALLAGATLETALARGVAAGSANALALGAGMLDPLEARRLEDEVSVWSGEEAAGLMDRLKDRGVIVTGATGIAGASARLFAAEGARLVVISRTESSCRELVESIVADGGRASHVVADLTDGAAAQAAADTAIERLGRVDGLFNVAGGSGRRLGDGPLHTLTPEAFEATMRLNATSHVAISRAGPAGDAAAGT